MAEYIEGKRPILEALDTSIPIKRVLIADNLKRDNLVQSIMRKAKAADIPVVETRPAKLDELSERGSHQGLMAEAAPFAYANLQDIINRAEAQAAEHDGRALIVILDHITDAGNLGAIARSAEVVGAAGIVIPNKRSARVTASTYKSSAGAISHIPIAQVANIKQTCARLKDAGFWIAGASEHAEELIWQTNMRGKMVLIMGNEGEGLARLTLESCDFLVRLPQVGKTESLNVAQAATACMFEWLRQNTE